MATHSRLNIFSDENQILNVLPLVEIRNKRAAIGVLTDLGANHSNTAAAVQAEKIPGFYDRKPLYARVPSKPLNAQHENGESCGKNGLSLENSLCDSLKVAPQIVVPDIPRLLSPLLSPMAVSPRSAKIDSLQNATIEKEALFDDHFFTSLYGDTHYNHLRSLELKTRARHDYMRRQRDISSEMRSVLVDWLVEVNEEYQLSNETLFLTVSLIDRFLSQMSVVRGKLQLVGTAAVLVAAKVEEIFPPQLSELVYITDDTYTTSQIIRMEALLLKNLEFFIGNAHPLTFIQNFAIVASVSCRVAHMAQYICELSLLKIETLAFRPSEVAAAALVLAMHHIEGNTEQWTEQVHKFSGIHSMKLQTGVNFLQGLLLLANNSPHKAIRNKFAQAKYSSVSLHVMRPTAPHFPTF